MKTDCVDVWYGSESPFGGIVRCRHKNTTYSYAISSEGLETDLESFLAYAIIKINEAIANDDAKDEFLRVAPKRL